MIFYITIKYATGLEDLYAAKANGLCAYENNSETMMIEHEYSSAEDARLDLDEMYGDIVSIED